MIAIIAILSAILFPVFGRARENARRSSCGSNLRQVGMALMQYAHDYDETLPWGNYTSTGNPPPGGYWVSGMWFWQHLIHPYVRSEQIFACPSSSTPKAGTDRLYRGHYGANRRVLTLQNAGGTVQGLKLSAMPAPAAIYTAMDLGNVEMDAGNVITPNGSVYYVPGIGDAKNVNCSTATVTAVKPDQMDDCQRGRHFGGINMVYGDGHVKWLQTRTVYQEALRANVPTNCVALGNCTQYQYGAWNPSNSS